MFGLNLDDAAILGAGMLLIALGLGGLTPLLLGHRRAVASRLRLVESLKPALSAATSYVRPPMPLAGLQGGAPVTSPAPAPTATEVAPRPAAEAPAGDEALAAKELLARLFSIRLLLSDVAEEVHSLREGYALGDDGIIEDIDDADDDLSDIDEDAYPDEGPATEGSLKAGEAA